jgi:hypothetical protein
LRPNGVKARKVAAFISHFVHWHEPFWMAARVPRNVMHQAKHPPDDDVCDLFAAISEHQGIPEAEDLESPLERAWTFASSRH